MRSGVLILAAAAALSQAYLFAEDGSAVAAAPMVESRHFAKRKTKLGEASFCAPKKIADHIKYQTLNTTDVALAEAMLLSWTNDASTQIENTGGSNGQTVTSNSVDAQVCNFSHDQRHIDPNDLKVLFDVINCGPRDQPQLGFGYAGSQGNDGFYVAYAPTGQLMPCANDQKSLKGS